MAGLVVAGLVGVLAVCLSACGPLSSPRADIERRFEREGRMLLLVPHAVPAQAAARGLRFTRDVLRSHELYLRHPGMPADYLHIAASGQVSRAGKAVTELRRDGELLFTASDWALFVDDTPLPLNLRGWEVHWAARTEIGPQSQTVLYAPVGLADSFMRDVLADDQCHISRGSWRLSQRGGGMPTTLQEEHDYDFQRAVNPFSVCGRDAGVMTYGEPDSPWLDYCAEARFYFGLPRTGTVVDTNTVPVGTDMLVAQGRLDGQQVAFGWRGGAASFVLLTRQGAGEWSELWRWPGKRPPLTNWVKIGLAVRAGHVAEAYLDGVPVVARELGVRVAGPFHLVAGRDLMEADDVRARSLHRPEEPGASVFVESRQFAGKNHKDRADPLQFEQWAEGAATFARTRWTDADGSVNRAVIMSVYPLMGDFRYESVPYCDGVGALPSGAYEFGLYPQAGNGPPDPRTTKPLFVFRTKRSENGWDLPELPDPAAATDQTEFALSFRRCAASGHRLELRVGDRWVVLSAPLPQPCHLAIGRASFDRSYVAFAHPKHHDVFCRNLVNELFEEAPTDWSWIEGAFRMACRWACQDQWNFMACGATGVPYMTSKHTFAGDQFHEYYLSMRAVFPWDAGDPTFEYDPRADRENHFQMLVAHDAWYNRRDLNFSFCTDGRNPLSGYSVVFGGDDNLETRLLRRGQVVARTSKPEFLFGTEPGREDVHWNWWKFTVRKQAGQLVVNLNDRLLFDYTDPEPIPSGHIGFWTIRNGFALARAVSIAEQVDSQPHVLYVTDGDDCPWRPLLHDSVTLTRDQAQGGLTRVTQNVGAGFAAVRYIPPAPVDLRQTPVLELPLRLSPTAAVNLHLFIGGRSYVVEVAAPVSGMKSLLTPRFEQGECFQLPTLSEFAVKGNRYLGQATPKDGMLRIDLMDQAKRLVVGLSEPMVQAITVGNTSNTGYLLAGNGGKNLAGSSYWLGVPTFCPQ